MAQKTIRLTAKQEYFAQRVVEGAPLSNAYRASYAAEGMQPSTIWSEASRMACHPKVAARIEALMAEKEAERRMLNLRHRDAILKQLQHEALTAKNDGARVRALELIGRSLDIFKCRVAVASDQRTADEVLAAIQDKLSRL